jgi:hypothetical protein
VVGTSILGVMGRIGPVRPSSWPLGLATRRRFLVVAVVGPEGAMHPREPRGLRRWARGVAAPALAAGPFRRTHRSSKAVPSSTITGSRRLSTTSTFRDPR